MLSAAPTPYSPPSIRLSPLREVQVAYRRLCVLRASGKNAEAETRQTEKLSAAIAQAREAHAVTDEQLEALFAREDDRLDDAQLLAEILLPLLNAASEAAPVRRNFSMPVAREVGPPPEEAPATESAGNGTSLLPGIADFIDEMLTQDRASTHPRNARHSA